MPAAVFASAETLLAGRGAAEIEHPGGTLLAHLRRVRELLAEWGASTGTQLAGLCHAAYGTDGFAVALFELDERVVLREVIGEAAESIVYCYGSCARKPSYAEIGKPRPVFTDRFTGLDYRPDSEYLQAFLEITAANEFDVFRHNADLADRYAGGMRTLLARAGDLLSAPARAAWSLERTAAPTGRHGDRIRQVTAGRRLTGSTNEDASDDVGTIDADGAVGFDPTPR